MKNLLYILATILVAFLAFVSVSCSNDDDGGDEPVANPTTVTIYYEYSADYLKYFECAYTVTDFEGNTNTINVTQSSENKIQFQTVGAKSKTAKVQFVSKRKSGVEADGAPCKFSAKGTMSITGDGQLEMHNFPMSGNVIFTNDGITAEALDVYADILVMTKTCEFEYKNGKVVSKEN